MIKKSGLLLILILLFGKVYAQNANITGKLIDNETKLPLSNANITAYEDEKIIYHTISDSTGAFSIPQNFLKQGNYIKVTSLTYNEYRIDLKPENTGGVNLGIFKLTPRKIELKEVKISSNKRYRDTTKIDLSKEKFERSVMIDDLLSKNSGFTKDEKGQIYYKGKLVTDLLVNGGNFFGKNNTDIYQLLPALVLDNIEIVETNIDSVTNVTLPVPQLKVNLKLKEKYNKGMFGDANLGGGTSGRYVANTGLYSYKNNQQVSLSFNSNNLHIGDNTIVQPKVSFSPTGNNSTLNTSKFTYRNLYANKVEVNFSVKAKIEDTKFISETDRQEEDASIFSKTFNSSRSKVFGIEDSRFNIHYKIDTLSTLDITQNFDHQHTKQSDSLNYFIKTGNLLTSAQLSKINNINTNLYGTEITYQKKFSAKQGRALTFNLKSNNNTYAVNEFDDVINSANQKNTKYFIDGQRRATTNQYILNTTYTEPISDSSYVNLILIYENNRLNYDPQIRSDTVLSATDKAATITNNYLKPGILYQKVFKKITFNALLSGIINIRDIGQNNSSNTSSFLNLDMNLKADYKISKKRSLGLNYVSVTNNPNIQQLTSLNNSFDLISQTTSNIYLSPEHRQSIKLDYTVRVSDKENIILSGQFDHSSSVFGYRLNNDITALQTSKTDNLGNSNGGQISFSFLKNISADKYLNYTNSISYQESPTIINNKFILNNGLIINQSLSTSLAVVKSLFTITPILSSSYSKYFYETNTINILTLTYYDKLSLLLKGYELNLYPLLNFNHSINNTHSFSMNGEIRKSIFKNYATVWVQAYDIFNSFTYYNNNIGASSYQTVKYSNVHRYIIVGASFKFNNIK